MRMNKWAGFLILFATCILAGCEKEKFTEPANIDCYFTLSATGSMDGLLTIESVSINLSNMEINGDRTNESRSLFFRRDLPDTSGQFMLIGHDAAQPVNLQIPQGIYERLVFDLHFREDEYEFDLDGDDDDETNNLSEYLQKARPGILLVGAFQHEGQNLKVVLSVDDDLSRIRTEAKQNGENLVVLEKLKPATGVFSFDVSYWFGLVTPQMIENADRLELNGEPAVFIYEDFNENLFATIVSRIEASTLLTISTK